MTTNRTDKVGTHEAQAREALRAALGDLTGAERCEWRRRLYRAAEGYAARSAARLGRAGATMRTRGQVARAMTTPRPSSAFGTLRRAVAACTLAELEAMAPRRRQAALVKAMRDGLLG